ncbi:hypothetical protein FRB90_006186 [Tulasnella sp. 427]|nr:hypothetical protein FRB90_006186 [Tulasnella sp. 427]
MAQQRTPGKAWTNSEDEKLIEAVQKYGENTESWKTIAEAVPGRTNKACRKRWKHSLHPSIKKTPWESEEDDQLLTLYAQHPGRWALISNHIVGRTDDACAKRYREALDPNLKKDDWTKEEDERLLEGFSLHGASWGKIGEELGRSGLGCRNRWRLLERRKNAAERRMAKPHSGEPSKQKKPKRKREPTEEETADVELSEDEDSRPGPSGRRQSTLENAKRPPTSTSNTSETTPVASASPDLSCTSRTGADLSPPLGNGPVIDPAIIGMALGKCPCGCASGANPCNCTSTNPTLNFNPNSQFIDSLDWNQLFPYLHAELPTVFVDPPPLQRSTSANQTALLNAYQEAVGIQDAYRIQSSRCNCSSSGCCSSEQKKAASCCSTQPVPSSCRQPAPSSPCVPDNGAIQPNRMHPESDAEAAKLVLDYATFFLQKQHGPSTHIGLSQQGQLPPNHPIPQSASLPASCQTPASHLLIGIIEKYQQQKSAPSSTATSGLLSSIPLPMGTVGCGCGCGDPNANIATKEAPQAYLRLGSEGPLSLQSTVQVSGASSQAVKPNDDLAPTGSCCGGNHEAPPAFAQHQRNLSSASTSIEAYIPPLEHTSIAVLPRFIPGCTCGCASGAPAGSCTCGCVGICLCGFQRGDQSAELTGNHQLMVTNDLMDISNSDQAIPQQESRGGCCGGGAKEHAPESTGLTIAMDLTPEVPMSLGEATLPSFILGCECGCAAGMDAGICSCGCVGVCCCASKMLEVPATNSPTVTNVEVSSADHARRVRSHSRGSSNGGTPSCCTPTTDPTTTYKIASNPSTTHRLSAQTPAPLPAYACGHPDCWRPGHPPSHPSMHALAGITFRTSAELMEHRKVAHVSELGETGGVGRGTGPSGSWLFRCGLAGCEKGWKSINGMQYHLQLSKVHFAGSMSRETESPDDSGDKITTPEEGSRSGDPTKPFKCPREGCNNAYKQAAGLKYHLAHGHPAVPPIQFTAL